MLYLWKFLIVAEDMQYMKQIFANQINSKMLDSSFDAGSMLSIPDKALLVKLFYM